jgi:hypothetical protein
MYTSTALIRSKILKQTQDNQYGTNLNIIDSQIYQYINENNNYRALYINDIQTTLPNIAVVPISNVTASSFTGISASLISGDFYFQFVGNTSTLYAFSQATNSAYLVSTQSNSLNKYYLFNSVFYKLSESTLSLVSTLFYNYYGIYYKYSNYFLTFNTVTPNTNTTSNNPEYTLASNSPYVSCPYILWIENLDTNILYPIDSYNNNLNKFQNVPINLSSNIITGINNNNFLTNLNFYKNGTTNTNSHLILNESNLDFGYIFVCFDKLRIFINMDKNVSYAPYGYKTIWKLINNTTSSLQS